MTKWPLMNNNITEDDADALVKFLSQRPLPILTNNKKVREFEEAWSKWLGVKYSVFVNSGSSANIITLAITAKLKGYGKPEVLVSPLNWVSDISAILHAGLVPTFCDINLKTLAMDEDEVTKKISPRTSAVLLTHILGYNGLTEKIHFTCMDRDVMLIEDCCESHGTMYKHMKAGSIGEVSNFSFYYAHHMTSIEGGMICTNDPTIYELARIYRSHGMLRECDDKEYVEDVAKLYPELNKDFIFMANSYNMRSTELNAVLALNQLSRLDDNNLTRKNNLDLFLNNLDSEKYYTDFNREGNSNYAFTLLLRNPDMEMRDKVEDTLSENGIEFRRGMSGGGNQLRQPYMEKYLGSLEFENFPNVEHVHHYGWYIGNYPELTSVEIFKLTELLNKI
jgi:CDP-4-dehydro-6-deoxyglucose reductase, E1